MTTLLHMSDAKQSRIFTGLGAVCVLGVAAALTLYNLIANDTGRQPKNVIRVVFETPYVGQGVDPGTPVMMHGFKVGEVNAITKQSGHVRLDVDLQSGPTAGLTDAVGIDFRPANYFGVTGINLTPANHGQVLRNGASITVTPLGNFTLQTLLYRLGDLSHQVATPRLISLVDRATRYTDALNPLFETMIAVSTSVTNVQTVSTAQLLRNTAAISVGLPAFLDGTISTGDMYLKDYAGTGFSRVKDPATNPYLSTYDQVLMDNFNAATNELATDPDKFAYGRLAEWFVGAEFDFFSKVGNLLSSHQYDLFPVLDQVRILADVVPRLLNPEDLSYKLHELRARLERMYAGSGDQRALQVKVVIDELPGVAAPLGVALGATG